MRRLGGAIRMVSSGMVSTYRVDPPPVGGGDLYFSSNFAGNSPFGFDSLWFDRVYNGVTGLYTVTRRTTLEAPDGRPYIDVQYVPGRVIDNQHPLGYGLTGLRHTPTPGVPIYFRWHTNTGNLVRDTPPRADIGGKYVIIGDQGGRDGSRVICNLLENFYAPLGGEATVYAASRNIDGDQNGGTYGFPLDAGWHSCQFMVTPSSKSAHVTSITQVGTTAIVTTTEAHGLTTGMSVDVQLVSGGAGGESEYDSYVSGIRTVTVTGTHTLTFTCAAGQNTPALNTYLVNSTDAQLKFWLRRASGGTAADMVFASPRWTSPATFGLSLLDGVWTGGIMRYGGFMGASIGEAIWTPAPFFQLGTFEIGPTFVTNWGG